MKKRICSVLLILCFLFSFMLTSVTAADKQYTDVLSDLGKDETFDVRYYPLINDPSNEKYMTIEVIQIAESTDKELFIYTYQPSYECGELEVMSMVMWDEFNSKGFGTDAKKEFHPQEYPLTLISSERGFTKYKVENYTVSSEAYRYYNISELFRKFNSSIDTNVSGGTTTAVAVAVGQQWCAYWFNDVLFYEKNTFNTVEINVTFTGELGFASGLKWENFGGKFDEGICHFVSFDVENYVVKYIYDADLIYNKRSVIEYSYLNNPSEFTYGEWESVFCTIRDSEQVKYDGGGLGSVEYHWERISSSESFINNMENQSVVIDSVSRDMILSSQWVFAFTETPYSEFVYMNNVVEENYTEVADVAILRLHFMDVTGKIYNLGTIMDKVTSDGILDGYGNSFDFSDFEEWFEKIFAVLGIVAVLALIAVCFPIVSTVFTLFFKGIGAVFKIVFFVLFLPFKLIGLFKKKKNE